MSTFFAVLNTNYKRTMPRIGSIIVITLVSMASIILGVYLTNKQQVFANIAVIGQVDESSYETAEQVLHITFLTEKPPISDLYEQKYDAYVTKDVSGNYEIKSLKNDVYKNTILALLKNPETQIPTKYTGRGTGESIIGFMMMFLLMISFGNMFAFADDKEQGQIKRIFSAPSSFGCYIGAHIVYSLSMFIPQFLLIVILKLMDINVGYSILEYFVMMIMIIFWGSSFALLLNTLIKKPDNANMLGNAIIVLSSILAGTFYAFSKDNRIIDGLIELIPQKQLMNIASTIQNFSVDTAYSIVYVVVVSLVMFLCSCIILNITYIKKHG